MSIANTKFKFCRNRTRFTGTKAPATKFAQRSESIQTRFSSPEIKNLNYALILFLLAKARSTNIFLGGKKKEEWKA